MDPSLPTVHVLTRLQRHRAQTARDAPDQVLRCLFGGPCDCDPADGTQLLWQHLRKPLATDLMRRDEGLTPPASG
jgi:hypothetical protein